MFSVPSRRARPLPGHRLPCDAQVMPVWSVQVCPLLEALDSVQSIPRLDVGVVAVGKGELDCVVSDEHDVGDADIARHRIDIEGADSWPLVIATGAAAITPNSLLKKSVGPTF